MDDPIGSNAAGNSKRLYTPGQGQLAPVANKQRSLFVVGAALSNYLTSPLPLLSSSWY